MRKFALLLILMLLPAAALANDYAWTATSDVLQAYGEDASVTIVLHGAEKGVHLGLPRIGWRYTDFSARYGDFVLIDEFQVASRAVGASGPLGKALRATYGVALSGADEAHLKGVRNVAVASRTLKVDIPADTWLTGPGEGSPYNSRMYCVRVYGERTTLTCTAKPWFGPAQELTLVQTEPLVWVLYAVDISIPPLEEIP